MESASSSTRVIGTLLPSLSHKKFVEIAFDLAIASKRSSEPSFKYRDPIVQERLFIEEAQKRGGDFAFGGWMEHRGNMFDTCYMASERRFIHLGVDISAPIGTPIHFPLSASIVRVITSTDNDVGWGTRVDLADHQAPCIYLLGHLAPDVQVRPGEETVPNQHIGVLGAPSVNGGTDPHLHIQVMPRSLYEKTAEEELDGYGLERELKSLRVQYPDPIKTLAQRLKLI